MVSVSRTWTPALDCGRHDDYGEPYVRIAGDPRLTVRFDLRPALEPGTTFNTTWAANGDGTWRVRHETTRRTWEFPRVPFVEYEAKDEAWARRLGHGRDVERKATVEIARGVIEEMAGRELVVRALPSDCWVQTGATTHVATP